MTVTETTTTTRLNDGRVLTKYSATGGSGDAIAHGLTASRAAELVSVTLHITAAPTTSQNYVITLDAGAGATFDTALYTLDLAAGSTTDDVFDSNDHELLLAPGDAIKATYTNTDNRTWGLQITFMENL